MTCTQKVVHNAVNMVNDIIKVPKNNFDYISCYYQHLMPLSILGNRLFESGTEIALPVTGKETDLPFWLHVFFSQCIQVLPTLSERKVEMRNVLYIH